MLPDAVRDAIWRAAIENGTNPAYALAVAERENAKGDPAARNSKSILGIYQMSGKLRHKHGAGDSLDPYEQAAGWNRSLAPLRSEMARVLGRDPSDGEIYLGHHFGSGRAARMLRSDPNGSAAEWFSHEERRLNPHIDRAGTVGRLNETITSDITQRMKRYGADLPDFSDMGEIVDTPTTKSKAAPMTAALDFSSLGTPL
jgi:hypothetical protein